MSSDLKLGNTLIRADLNVPMDKQVIQDDFRINKAIQHLDEVRGISKSVTFLSHLGRPSGVDPEYSLKPVAEKMSTLIKEEVIFIDALYGTEVKSKIDMLPGKIFLLENLRFHNEEIDNDIIFAEKVTNNFDTFILDAFGASHRNHASIVSFGKFIESYQGMLMTDEVRNLELLTNSPKKPFTVILGGAKISDKLNLINNLLPKVDNLLIGGGMCFTFLKALGLNIGNSLCEDDYLATALNVLDSQHGNKIILPTDIGVSLNQ